MDPLTIGLISGGIGLLGNMASNQASSAQAARQMDFQRDMSGSAHQREVNDLRAAGLNPILSAMGAGSSSPAGASGQVSDLGSSLQSSMATAIAVRDQNKNLAQKDAQIDNTKADTMNKSMQGALLANQAANSAMELKLKQMQGKIMNETMHSMIKKAKAEGDYSEINQIMGVINSGASSAGQLINPFKGMLPGKK